MKVISILTLVVVLLLVAWNYLVVGLPLNGVSTGEVSDLYPTLVTPAGYAFSIWGLIYLGLISFGIYQVLPARIGDASLHPVRYWLMVNLVINGLWLVAWHYQVIWLSVLLMLGILVSLIFANLPLHANANLAPHWVRWTFEVYMGWITVATVVNVSVWLFDMGMFTGGDELIGFILVMLVATIIGFGVLLRWNAYAYLLVLVWAFGAIGVKLMANPGTEGWRWIPWGLAAFMAVVMIFKALR
jgi:benzodiazapine receptor